ncbi:MULTISPECIES: hypothetical protein [unclassified Microbacterium]|uniref:hypothetical protein n=1 Tax=unclassified Microbacterium TaxID=2609290 RepID=UPI00214BC516|nr:MULTISPECIES: hypothetical protein [unclassified Microbacterium]MCR2784682.1 hypothetical protein [Microbacterium sp. zg.B96]MDL5352866.1 hypothetical protein [Microbacterium sp. zg-YB36]WIM16224.1 hypothetical protein QNO11_00910 [Microbacterium sp. zg-B96]
MAKVIDLDAGGEVAAHNASTLQEVSAELPSPSVITQVDGNRTEEAPNRFTARLELRSEAISRRVEAIRAFVAANAEALSNAVTALRESDQLSASAAAQTAAIIDDVAAGRALGGAAAGAAAGGAAGAAASAGAAQGAKDVFGG